MHCDKNVIDTLPHEVEVYLFSFFSIDDIPTIARVSKWWLKLAHDVYVWRKLYYAHFPKSSLVKNCIRQSGTDWRNEFKKARDLSKNWREGNYKRNSTFHPWGGTSDVLDTMGIKLKDNKAIMGSLVHRTVHLAQITNRNDSEFDIIWSHREPASRVSCVDLDGDVAVAGYTDGALKCWDIDSGELKVQFDRELQWVESIVVEGNRVAAGYERDIGIFDLNEQKLVHTLMDHLSNVMCLAFDGSSVFSGSIDKKCNMWDLRTGDVAYSTRASNTIGTLQYDPSRNLLVLGSGVNVILYDTRTDLTQSLSSHAVSTKALHSLRFDGNRLVVGCAAKNLSVWDMTSGVKPNFSIPHTARVRSINLDDTTVTCSSSSSVFRYHFD